MKPNYEFVPGADSRDAATSLGNDEVKILYARLRPDSPKGRLRESLVLDQVVVDLDAEHRVLGIEVLLPAKIPTFAFVLPTPSPLYWTMHAWNLDAPQPSSLVAFDPAANAFRVTFDAPADDAATYRLSENVWVRATSSDIASLWITL